MCRVLLLVVVLAFAARQVTSTNDVGVPQAPQERPGQTTLPSIPKPQVYQLNVRTDIRSRYARTLVTSRLANPADRAQEVTFQVTIPESAFISKFIMEVDGELMEGNVRERMQAKQEYQQAVQSGQSAGHVATATVRDSNEIRISVNVGAQAKASFNLTYEELLVRRKGRYELAVNLNPRQLVREMTVDVYIQENHNITDLKVPNFRSTNEIALEDSQEDNSEAQIDWVSGRQAHVHFAPSLEQQRRLGAAAGGEERGLGGQFIVRYDVDREPGAGEVLALDGYFVHFFSPPELEPLPKHVIFVLDVSGSMHGRKMEQLREAMDAILQELRPGDFFNLIEFSYSVTLLDLESPANSTVIQPSGGGWSNSDYYGDEEESKNVTLPTSVKAFPASAEYITKARDAVRKMSAGGGTNIHDAVFSSLHVAKTAASYDGSVSKLPEPIVIFLTDGEATVGETRADRILQLTKDHTTENSGVPIFSLAFGQDADLAFLKRLSLRAGAFARKIYEAADAALQLRDFYRQVASPLLSNVTFNYSDTQVDGSSVTKQKFSMLFSGSELVVAGKLRDTNKDVLLNGEVQGVTGKGALSFSLFDDELPLPGSVPTTPPPQPGDRFLERLWAYLSIKQSLEKYDADREDDTKEQDSPALKAKKKALELALKFAFVTPITSLVVVKNDSTPSTGVKTSDTKLVSIGAPESSSVFQNYGGGYPGTAGAPGSGGGFSTTSLSAHTQFSAMAAYPQGASGRPGMRPQQGTPGHRRPAPAPQSSNAYRPPSPKPIQSYVPRDDMHFLLEEDTLSLDANYEHKFNVTILDVSELSWLREATEEPSGSTWRPVLLGNSSEIHKILLENQTVPEDQQQPCASPVSVTYPTSHCRPLASCAIAEIADNQHLYISSYKCSIGPNSFLGICCPDFVFTLSSNTTAAATTSTEMPTPQNTVAAATSIVPISSDTTSSTTISSTTISSTTISSTTISSDSANSASTDNTTPAQAA